MERTELQGWKDKAFQSRSKEQWDAVMQEIKDAVKDDEKARDNLRDYCSKILPRKKEFWAKYPKPNGYQAKPKMMFSEDTDKAIGELAKALTAYINKQINNTENGD